ncbi:MAG: Secretion system C-terminal sorting domain [Bacteroidota bacterium]|jgi:hypothetical protein
MKQQNEPSRHQAPMLKGYASAPNVRSETSERTFGGRQRIQVSVYGDATQSVQLQIKDVVGRIVENQNINLTHEVFEINTTQYANGVYFISIIDNAANVLMTNKFIITK